jgi:hypothetical protein
MLPVTPESGGAIARRSLTAEISMGGQERNPDISGMPVVVSRNANAAPRILRAAAPAPACAQYVPRPVPGPTDSPTHPPYSQNEDTSQSTHSDTPLTLQGTQSSSHGTVSSKTHTDTNTTANAPSHDNGVYGVLPWTKTPTSSSPPSPSTSECSPFKDYSKEDTVLDHTAYMDIMRFSSGKRCAYTRIHTLS